MTWDETKAALQLLAEERVGFVMRERERMARAARDAAWAQAADVAREIAEATP